MNMTFLKKFCLLGLIIVASLILLAVISHRSLPTWTPPAPTATEYQPNALHEQTLSGIYPLHNGQDAFLARLSLVENAKHRLDVQYYIWHDDTVGRLLLQRLYLAAERGVKVRLLLDDNNTKGMDELLASFNNHPNIELRLFNPFMQRSYRPLGYLSDFFRLNRRMHNKSLTADGMATIVGGRNIGDEYFNAGSGVMFADLDVLAFGKAASDVEQDFERYWHSKSTYAAHDIIKATNAPFDTTPTNDDATKNYLNALSQSALAKHLKDGDLPLIWANARLISDDPAKGLGNADSQNTVPAHIAPIIAGTQEELVIVSPYFVPTQDGTAKLSRLSQADKNVIVLTNSLTATDVAPVHAGYAKYRKALLQAGVRLFELKPNATVSVKNHSPIIKSQGASLHAKTFVIDQKQLFVGSFNMDPRSAKLNTEMGFIIESPALAKQLVIQLQTHQDTATYQVGLNNNQLTWQTKDISGETVVFESEPESSLIQRLFVAFCSLLPIEWLL